MADYQCSPVWVRNTPRDVAANTPIDGLPISAELKTALLEWAVLYDNTINWEYPPSSGFASLEAAKGFAVRGEELARQLAAELGNSYSVTYFDNSDGSTRPI